MTRSIAELTAIRNDPPPFEPAQVTSPSLIARGDNTARHHVEAVEALGLDELPAASLHVIAGAGHNGHQSHPSEFTDLVLQAVSLAATAPADRPAP